MAACALFCLILLLVKDSESSCIHGDVRLIGGLADHEGNVQVCVNGEWGYVCDSSWRNLDELAEVVCRQLNYSATDAIYKRYSYYGFGNGTIWMDYVNCVGSEMKLLDCPTKYSIGYIPDCDYRDIAGVICPFGGSNCTNGDIRLVNPWISNIYSSRSEGRVEVCSNNEWGTVCSNGWGSNDATVACKQLGYTGYVNYYTSNFYGHGSGTIWLTNLGCSSSHSNLFDCPHSTDTSSCTASNTGVVCYSIDSSSCTHGDVKLWSAYESTPDNEGIPLVCSEGTWYPIDRYSSCHSLILACKAAGYSKLVYREYYGYAYGYYYKDHYDFSCSSNSNYNNILECSYTIGDSFKYSARVKCHTKNIANYCSAEGSVRLVDGETANEGRIEYCYDNEWAPMCDFYDSDYSYCFYNGELAPCDNTYTANLICKELGYSSIGSQVFADNRFGRSSVESSLEYLSCSDYDSSLSHCYASKHSQCEVPVCYIHYGLRCYNKSLSDPECTDGDIRLVDGIIQQEGRPEVCVNGLWSQICGIGWSTNDAYMTCVGLGYVADNISPTVLLNSEYGSGNGPIVWGNVDCYPWNKDIFGCTKTVYPNFYCDNFNIAGVRCTEGCTDGDVRLVGGASVNEGTVEVCYDELWGLISDNGWSNNEAIVICRQLGYSSVENADFKSVVGSYYGKPNKTIHLSNVNCSSLETNVSSCNVHQLSLSDGKVLLPTTDVAGVKCSLPDNVTTPIFSPSCTTNINANIPCSTGGSVRLTPQMVKEESLNEVGMVEYCNGTYWTPLCSIDNKVATVICKQLGHTSYSWGTLLSYEPGNQTSSAASLVQDIKCIGDEDTVSDCTIITGCMECSKHIGLRCFDTNTPCNERSVRLVNSSSTSEGRVEVCVNGVWGSVCDKDWDTTDGLVVCLELGYTKQEPTVYYNSHYGDGSYPIVYSNINCKGWENSISDCDKDDHLSFTCYHGNTAGLKCNGEKIEDTTTSTNTTTSTINFITSTMRVESSGGESPAAIVGAVLGAVAIVTVIVSVVAILILIQKFLRRSASSETRRGLDHELKPRQEEPQHDYEEMDFSTEKPVRYKMQKR